VLERQERTALGLLITVLVILSAGHLILTALGNAPFAAPYSEGSREGDLVVITGVVEGITPTSTGMAANSCLIEVEKWEAAAE
jgi:hypothetical protein